METLSEHIYQSGEDGLIVKIGWYKLDDKKDKTDTNDSAGHHDE